MYICENDISLHEVIIDNVLSLQGAQLNAGIFDFHSNDLSDLMDLLEAANVHEFDIS